jgi:hypothetical protein
MPEEYCYKINERLINFWEFHRGFDANIADLSRYSNVSRDTVYRWLNRKSLPKPTKAHLIEEWLNKRAED